MNDQTTQTLALQARGLVKRYGSVTAINGCAAARCSP